MCFEEGKLNLSSDLDVWHVTQLPEHWVVIAGGERYEIVQYLREAWVQRTNPIGSWKLGWCPSKDVSTQLWDLAM